MAEEGLCVEGIDTIDRHIQKAQQNTKPYDAITIQKMDYHTLDFRNNEFDGGLCKIC